MRDGLRGLTVRGRAFLAAGLTAILCAIVMGQGALVRVGVLVTVLPLVTAWYLGRSHYRLTLARTIAPETVTAGQPARVELELHNEGRTPTGVMMLEEQVPYVLGTRPRFVLEGISRGWRRHVHYQLRSDLRGRYQIGPMTVRVADPFGLVEMGRAFHSVGTLTVTPKAVPLPDVPLSGSWTGSGDNRPRAFATGSAEDVTVRDYRRGDDLRRVHWRSSARVGELMVRREEQPWQSRATIFIDNRARVHRGHGAGSSLETAVTLAASVAVHLTQRGFAVRLMTADGDDPTTSWHERSSTQNTRPLLEALAVLTATKRSRINTDWLTENGATGMLLGIFGHLEDDDMLVLRRMRTHATNAMAAALRVEEWAGRTESVDRAGQLAGQGWRATDAGPRDRMPAIWQELGAVGRSPVDQLHGTAVPRLSPGLGGGAR